MARTITRRSFFGLAGAALVAACGEGSSPTNKNLPAAVSPTEPPSVAPTSVSVPPTPIPETLRLYADKLGIEVAVNVGFNVNSTGRIVGREFNTYAVGPVWRLMQPDMNKLPSFQADDNVLKFALQ